jgi:hypothetical protein
MTGTNTARRREILGDDAPRESVQHRVQRRRRAECLAQSLSRARVVFKRPPPEIPLLLDNPRGCVRGIRGTRRARLAWCLRVLRRRGGTRKPPRRRRAGRGSRTPRRATTEAGGGSPPRPSHWLAETHRQRRKARERNSLIFSKKRRTTAPSAFIPRRARWRLTRARGTERIRSSGGTRARGEGGLRANMAAAMPYPDKCVLWPTPGVPSPI